MSRKIIPMSEAKSEYVIWLIPNRHEDYSVARKKLGDFLETQKGTLRAGWDYANGQDNVGRAVALMSQETAQALKDMDTDFIEVIRGNDKVIIKKSKSNPHPITDRPYRVCASGKEGTCVSDTPAGYFDNNTPS